MQPTSLILGPPSKRTALKELIALLVFAVVGGIFAMPCLCVQGAIAGPYRLLLFIGVFLRLARMVHTGKFRFADYFIYFTITVGFSIWTDPHF